MSKVFIRFFTIADYEEEEVWLREQQRKGLKLAHMTPPCFYYFEECTPEDVIYRLDFKNGALDDEYLQMYRDFGWEYAGKCIGWYYFRKPAEETVTEEEGEIFSDNASKVSMVEKIIMRRMLPLMSIFLCCVIPNLMRSMDSVAGYALKGVFGILTVLYIYLITYCTVKLAKLKKQYQDGY